MLFTLETERESSVKGFTELIVNSVRGFCMALADSVPGVSGGTVAFLLGFTTGSSARWTTCSTARGLRASQPCASC